MVDNMQERIVSELQRVIGPAGYGVRFDPQPNGQPPNGQRMVRLDVGEAVWAMCPDDLLELLLEMPDRAGPLALRQAADQHPHKMTCP